MSFFSLLKKTWEESSNDNISRLAAALSYYTIFSLAPLLIIAIGAAGIIFGRDAVQGKVLYQFSNLLGPEGAKTLEVMIASAYKNDGGIIATIVGVGALLLGATGLFVQLHDALNSILKLKRVHAMGTLEYLKNRWLSFTLILAVGFLLLISLFLSAALSSLSEYSTKFIEIPKVFWEIINFALSLLMTLGLFAALYKYLPNVTLRWGAVLAGALLSSLLFNVGKHLIGLYLGQAAISSSYGAAGSLVIILIWSFYSSYIFLLGSEFNKVRASDSSLRILPKMGYVF